jgi:tocopherol O-methyltransferase
MSTTSGITVGAQLDGNLESVRDHYDSLSFWYRLFWGDHLHHGWFNTGTEKAREAQIEMLWQCTSLLRTPIEARVLDVGCGYGATGIFLASELACQVDGLNVSPNQLMVAKKKVAAATLSHKVQLRLQDAESFVYPADYYDLVWTMESSEHFADKQQYFHQVRRTLRRDGRLLVAAWTGSMASYNVRSVARHFVCPKICTADEYVGFIESAGMRVQNLVNATTYVVPTWQICLSRVKRFGLLRHFVSREVRSFADGLEIILDAYLSGELNYTIIAGSRG